MNPNLCSLYTLSFSLLALQPLLCSGQNLTVNETAKLTHAIYLAEGGEATAYPYGIKINGHHYSNREARVICERTCRNCYRRWASGGKQEDFITSLGERYCPKRIDPVGNRNWVKNVSKLINKERRNK